MSDDETKILSNWMMENSFATGHGDSVEDLLAELKWQVDELREKIEGQKNVIIGLDAQINRLLGNLRDAGVMRL